MEYKVEKYQPGDEENIVELLQLVFNGWPHFDLPCTPLEHWKWKFVDNPLSRLMIVKAVRKSDNKIIGCYHGVDLNVKIGDEILNFNNGGDVAVHQDFRRMGMYKKMNEYITELRWNAGIKIIFWSTGNPILAKVKPGRIKFPKVVSHFYRIRNVDLHFKMVPIDNAWIKKIGYLILNSINNVSNFAKSHLSSKKKVKIKRVSHFDASVNIFWDTIVGDYSFIVERTQDYLNWRYCDIRGGNYHVSIAEEEGSLIGYCVSRINRYNEDYPKGYIVDLLTHPNRYDVSEALIQDAVDFFDGSNVNIIDCLAIRSSQLGNSLKKCGFVDSRSRLFLVVRMKGMVEEEMAKYSHRFTMKKMHFVYGDFDTI